MNTTESTQARIYVGTYGKYNSGSIKGAWLDLEDYADKDAFLSACAELHKDEADPEFMFQDMEGIPEGMADEGFVTDELFKWLALDESDRNLVSAFSAATGQLETLESAQDAFQGIYSSGADFAEQTAEDTGAIPKDFPSWISIDWEATWNCALRFDYFEQEHNGKTYFFRNC